MEQSTIYEISNHWNKVPYLELVFTGTKYQLIIIYWSKVLFMELVFTGTKYHVWNYYLLEQSTIYGSLFTGIKYYLWN